MHGLYTFTKFMHPKPFTYNQVFLRFHSLIMMVLLVWLSVCTPIVYAVQQDASVTFAGSVVDDDSDNPLSGTNEEKVESGGNAFSEYLHEVHAVLPPVASLLTSFKAHAAETLSVFHPELLSPPPERVA